MDYREALDWLYSTQMFGIKLGLENAHLLVAALDVYPTSPHVVHVAGTNGKGSVCAMAESIARAAGHRTGLFTSPHLVHYNERIQINGIPATDQEIAEFLTHIRQTIADWNPHPTFFEITTALGLLLFKKHACDVIILETGMGGRLDATNIVTPSVSVLTKIDLDHTHWLGDTLVKIATEKAGIIKPNIPAVTLPQTQEVLAVFQNASPKLCLIDQPYTASPVALAGEHQHWNAAIAIRALEIAGVKISPDSIANGLREVQWSGRFQEIRPGIFLDGAHNPAAARTLTETWQTRFPGIFPTILIGILADKDVTKTLAALSTIASSWITVAPRSPRSLAPEKLAKAVRQVSDRPIEIGREVGEILNRATPPLLICGSLFLVGEALAWFKDQSVTRATTQ